jgi:hypothetical protein
VLLLAQVKVTPVMVLPFESFAVAVNWTVPGSTTDDAPVILIEARVGGFTGVEPPDETPPQPAAAKHAITRK